MDKTIGGELVFYSYEVYREIILQCLEFVHSELPSVSFTHYGMSYDLNCNAISWNTNKFHESLSKTECDHFWLLDFPDEQALEMGWPKRISISFQGHNNRNKNGATCFLYFDEELNTLGSQAILDFSDLLANEIPIQSGYLHNFGEYGNQNYRGTGWFESTGRLVERDKLKWDTVMQEEVLDVELNPSHSHLVDAVDFTAAWTNYLGREYLDHLGFDKAQDVVPILEDIAHEIVVLSDSLVRVTLFKDPFAFGHPDSIERLWAFRKRLRIDEIAHELLPDSQKPSRYVDLPSK